MRYIMVLIASALVIAACGSSEPSADPERFCEILVELDEQDTTGLPADEALPIIREGRDKYVEGTEVAPEEIKADAELFADGVLKITDLLIAAGGDQTQVDAEALQSVSEEIFTPEFDAAADRVNAWRDSNCS